MFLKESISDEDDLYKRIAPIHFNYEENRVSMGAFKTSNPNQSVDWSKYRNLQESLQNYPDNGLVSIKAKYPRKKALAVCHDPLCINNDGVDNQAHTLIEGNLKKASTAKFLLIKSISICPPAPKLT